MAKTCVLPHRNTPLAVTKGTLATVFRSPNVSPTIDWLVIARAPYGPRMKTLAFALAMTALCVGAAVQPDTARAGELPLTVVELFTSQGCSSCPPAEAYLGELAKRPELLALEQHVDYWDYIGWNDPFASPLATERQRHYTKHLGRGYVYTPQIVVDGISETIGSDRPAVERAIAQARSHVHPHVDIRVSATSKGRLIIELPANAASHMCDVFLIGFDPVHMTKVMRGENGGRTLDNYNVVRDFQRVGFWTGQAATIELPKLDADPNRAWAVIVQDTDAGPILGAARITGDALSLAR